MISKGIQDSPGAQHWGNQFAPFWLADPKWCTPASCDRRPNSSKIGDTRFQQTMAADMARKPPPPWELFQHVNDLVNSSGIKGEVDKGVRALAQTALSRLDLVSREEFDAQTELLKRTRARVVALETELEELTRELESLSREG